MSLQITTTTTETTETAASTLPKNGAAAAVAAAITAGASFESGYCDAETDGFAFNSQHSIWPPFQSRQHQNQFQRQQQQELKVCQRFNYTFIKVLQKVKKKRCQHWKKDRVLEPQKTVNLKAAFTASASDRWSQKDHKLTDWLTGIGWHERRAPVPKRQITAANRSQHDAAVKKKEKVSPGSEDQLRVLNEKFNQSLSERTSERERSWKTGKICSTAVDGKICNRSRKAGQAKPNQAKGKGAMGF